MTAPRPPFDPAAYWERRLQPFDLSVVGYSGLGLRYNEWLYRVRAAVFRRLLRSIELPPSARVLDVGSGTGFYLREWQRSGVSQLTGSDLTTVAVGELQERFPGVDVARWDVADEPPFPAATFDAISAFDVLFHVVDDTRYRAALENIAALLREGGYVFLSENLVHAETVHGEHQVSRTLAEFERTVQEVGLELVLRRPMFVLMNIPIDSDSRLHWWFWNRLHALLLQHRPLGGVIGGLLFPFELALVRLLREGPGTEVVVCRKPRSQ